MTCHVEGPTETCRHVALPFEIALGVGEFLGHVPHRRKTRHQRAVIDLHEFPNELVDVERQAGIGADYG